MPLEPEKPKVTFAVARHVEGDEEGNRQRRKEAFARMMKHAHDDHQPTIDGDTSVEPMETHVEDRKSFLKKMGIAVWCIYLMSVLVFAPFYNWKFAQQSGFLAWLVGGEVVGTCKGVLWPYFLWSDHRQGLRQQQAIAYFDALSRCGSTHGSTNEMLKEAIVRADERSKILGAEEGRKQLATDCATIAKVLHADLDEASAVVPPPFLAEFHKKCVEDNQRMGEIIDQMMTALVARDNARIESLEGELGDIAKRFLERMTKQRRDLGLGE